MIPDPSIISQAAADAGLPPAILYSLGQVMSGYSDQTLTGGVTGERVGVFGITADQARALGYQPSQLAGNIQLQAQVAAQLLSQQFSEYGSWEQALSSIVGGDPAAYLSPNSPVGGSVNSIMGIAASRSTYGLDQMGSSVAMEKFLPASHSFAESIEKLAKLGGVVTSQQAQSFTQGVRGVAQHAAASSMAQTTASNLPFQKFDAMPFASGAMQSETENFGYQWAGTTEVGNDYGMSQGTQLNAAMAGTVEYRYLGTGLTAYLRLDNGWTIGYGHLSAPIVPPGTRVSAGQAIAMSGGSPGVTNPQGMQQAGLGQYAQDPVSVGPGGVTGGPHLEIQLIGPDGKYYDPQSILQNTSGQNAGMAIGPMGGAKTTGTTGTTGATAAPPTKSTQGNAQKEKDPTPEQIDKFASEARGLGLSPSDIQTLMPRVAPLRRMMLEKGTDLTDIVKHQGQSDDEVLKAIRETPHPMYPNLNAGDLVDSFRQASLHSVPLVGRMPYSSEAASFVAGGLNNQAIIDHYLRQSRTEPNQPLPEGLNPQTVAPPKGSLNQETATPTDQTRQSGAKGGRSF